jgi:hypothetical protein
MSCPLLWEESVNPGVAQQLEAIAESHRRVKDACQEDSELSILVQMHSKAGSKDPCSLAAFTPVKPQRGAAEIQALQQNAESQKKGNQTKADSTVAGIDAQVAANNDLALDALAADLKSVHANAVQDLGTISEKLEEIVSPDLAKRKGRDDVLTNEFGAAVVSNSQDEAKTKMYKGVKAKRIEERTRIAIAEENKLCETTWDNKLTSSTACQKDILDKQACVTSLRGSANQSVQARDDINLINNDIDVKHKEIGAQSEKCQAQKKKTAAKLAEKRKVLKADLQKMVASNTEYIDAYVENETAQKTIVSLRACQAEVANLKQAAQDATSPAVAACEEWQRSALSSAESVERHIEGKYADCKTAMLVPVKAAAFNLQFAKKLHANTSRDNQAENDYLQQEIQSNQQLQDERQQQMQSVQNGVETGLSIDDIESDCATLMTEKGALDSALAKCNATKQSLQSTLQLSEEAWNTLKNFFAGEDVAEQVRAEAETLADASYKSFTLWMQSKRRVSFAPLPIAVADSAAATNSGVLALNDPSVQRQLEEMERRLEQKYQQKFDQFRAEQLLRAAAVPSRASSAAPSEADFCVVSEND